MTKDETKIARYLTTRNGQPVWLIAVSREDDVITGLTPVDARKLAAALEMAADDIEAVNNSQVVNMAAINHILTEARNVPAQ